MPPQTFVGRPVGPNGQLWGSDNMLQLNTRIPGIATPNFVGGPGEWWQMPTAGTQTGASPSNGYGQLCMLGNGASPEVGTYAEWKIAVPGVPQQEGIPGLQGLRYFYIIYSIGPNIGKMRITINGVAIGDIDGYTAAGWPWTSSVLWIPGVAPKPELLTVRAEVIAPNPAASGNFLLIDSLAICCIRS